MMSMLYKLIKAGIAIAGLILAAIPINQWVSERADRDLSRLANVIQTFETCQTRKVFEEFTISEEVFLKANPNMVHQNPEGYKITDRSVSVSAEDSIRMWEIMCARVFTRLMIDAGVSIQRAVTVVPDE